MEHVKKKELLFLIVCLLLGTLAEISFFHGKFGVSSIIFLTGFYTVFFIRYRKYPFGQRRMGILLMLAILILSSNYFLYDMVLFHVLNVLILPFLVMAHLVMITKPAGIRWHQWSFLRRMIGKVLGAIPYNTAFLAAIYRTIFKRMDEQKADTIRKLLVGLLIGIPVFFLILILLTQADQAFEELVGVIPAWFLGLEINTIIFRIGVALVLGCWFFGTLQSLPLNRSVETENTRLNKLTYDGIVSIPILLLLNAVYLLFTIVQFTYFFGGELQAGMSYSEYARRGFFELLFVSLVNLTALVVMMRFTRPASMKLDRFLKSMYSLLIIFSGILLVSAFQRLALYEAHYGYTLERVLPHVFMVFLFIIFIYTLIKVWVNQLPLLHFYIVLGLLFYAGLNAVNVEEWIVERNLERYEQTGKIDISYLETLSYTGVNGLLDLYEMNPDYPGLEQMIENKKESYLHQDYSWQSYNLSRAYTLERLEEWKSSSGD